jgi:hypothetical protein
MGTTTAIRPPAGSTDRDRRALDETETVLGHRLTFNQLVVLAPRLALHALPHSSAAELRMKHRDQPSARWSKVRSVRRAVPTGRPQHAFSAVLTADDGFILGCLLLFFDDARGVDSTSRTTACALAGQLQSALRRTEVIERDPGGTPSG